MTVSTPPRRVAVTGLGAVGPGGVGIDALWDLITRPVDLPVVPHVTGFVASHWLSHRDQRRSEPYALYAVAAAAEAWSAAGSPVVDPGRVGVVLGNAFGASAAVERAARTLHEEGPEAVPAAVGLMACSSAAAAMVARHLGATGPVQVASGACASGIYGVADGAALVAWGLADVVLAGGTEGDVGPTVSAAYENLRARSRSGWVRPFDVRRDGFVYSEGAGVLVLEAWDDAVARGATILAEVAGWANTNDAHDMVRPNGVGAREAMRLAIERAGIFPGDVVHVNAHGTGTQLNDPVEAEAINDVLGRGTASVTSIKGRAGHGGGAAGAIEAVVVVESFRRRLLPPVATDLHLDPDIRLDVVHGEPRAWEPGPTLDNGFGIGGQNGSLLLLPPGWR